jgi:lycopene cyclase domain-containing protein
VKYEYLIFNIIVISGPLFFGSLKRFYFLNHIPKAVTSIIIAAIPFIIWDVAVTNRHWFFADEYTLGFRIFHLPIEEIMFFFTVPFACIFTWEMVKKHPIPFKGIENSISKNLINLFSAFLFIFSIVTYFYGKEYTTLAGLFFIASVLIDRIWGASILTNKKFLFFFILVSFFTLIFNGYLTWRPIVTYDEIYQLGFRIFTIPIEDFFFGYALLIIATSLFEKMINITK